MPPPARARRRHIGAILMDEGKLSAADAEQVLKRQRELGWRFGEAAIELNFITDADLQQALAKQYEFPYLVRGPEGVSKELIAAWDPFHPVVEELRAVRTQLLMRWFNPGAGRRTLAITSPCAREGRSFIAANLAVVFSQLGQRTLLIDADFRAPRQQSIFNISDRFGLSSRALRALGPVGRGAGRRPDRPRGAARRAAAAQSARAAVARRASPALLAKAQAEYDMILIDTPPVTEYADAPPSRSARATR